jgi:hypothetical protein
MKYRMMFRVVYQFIDLKFIIGYLLGESHAWQYQLVHWLNRMACCLSILLLFIVDNITACVSNYARFRMDASVLSAIFTGWAFLIKTW